MVRVEGGTVMGGGSVQLVGCEGGHYVIFVLVEMFV